MKKIIVLSLVLFISIIQVNGQQYKEVNYKKLCSKSFVDDYASKSVSFKVLFIGEWIEIDAYSLYGIKTKDRVFINHRDISYAAHNSSLGSSDLAFPAIPISISKETSDIVYELQRGDIIEIKGVAEKHKNRVSKNYFLHITVSEIRKINK